MNQKQIEYTCPECGNKHMGPELSILGERVFERMLCDGCDKKLNPAAFQKPEPPAPVRTQADWDQLCSELGYSLYSNVQKHLLPGPAQQMFPLDWDPLKNKKGLALIGDSRTGKTMLVMDLAKRLWMAKHDVHIRKMARFARLVGSLDAARHAEVDRCCEAGILVLDDIDKPKFTEAVELALYEILEERYSAERPTICTFNATSRKEMYGMFGHRAEPIINRLKDTCRLVAIADPERQKA